MDTIFPLCLGELTRRCLPICSVFTVEALEVFRGYISVLADFPLLKQVPEIIIKKVKVYFGSQFWSFQCAVSWSHCFWAAWGGITPWSKHVAEEALTSRLLGSKQRGRGWVSMFLLREGRAPVTQLPLPGPTSQRFCHLPALPPVSNQAFKTWAFEGHSKLKLQQLAWDYTTLNPVV